MNETASLHRKAWDLIPWILNGSASAQDRLLVHEHLNQCEDCRAELDFQRTLQTALQQQAPVNVDAEESWQQLVARLNDSPPLRTAARGRSTQRWLPWAVAAMLLEALAIGALATSVWGPASTHARIGTVADNAYRTLAAPSAVAAAARIRAVFTTSMTLDQLQSLLSASNLQIVAGPSSAQVWSLGPAPGAAGVDVSKALQALRANPDVRFAEPIEGAP